LRREIREPCESLGAPLAIVAGIRRVTARQRRDDSSWTLRLPSLAVAHRAPASQPRRNRPGTTLGPADICRLAPRGQRNPRPSQSDSWLS